MQVKPPVITVDGPSGTGKGTLCSQVSRWLQWNLLDSGALYRILALLAQRENIDVSNAVEVAGLARAELGRSIYCCSGRALDKGDVGWGGY